MRWLWSWRAKGHAARQAREAALDAALARMRLRQAMVEAALVDLREGNDRRESEWQADRAEIRQALDEVRRRP